MSLPHYLASRSMHKLLRLPELASADGAKVGNSRQQAQTCIFGGRLYKSDGRFAFVKVKNLECDRAVVGQ